MKCTQRICVWTSSMVLLSCPLAATAQQAQPALSQAQPQAATGQAEVQAIATVDGDPITQQEVQATLQPQLQGRQVDPQQAAQIQQQVIDSLIDSRLVEHYVLEHGPDVEEQEVQQAVDQLKQQLQSQQVSLDQFLASRGYNEQLLKDRIEGSLAWQKFQQQQVTEDKLRQYFQQNQQQFQAESFEQAKPQVANAYIGKLWTEIVEQMKPEAEIRTAAAPAGAAPQAADAPR